MNRRRRPNVSSPLGLSTFTRLRLRAALFLAGAVVMALGILGARIIGPHFGAGLVCRDLVDFGGDARPRARLLVGRADRGSPALAVFVFRRVVRRGRRGGGDSAVERASDGSGLEIRPERRIVVCRRLHSISAVAVTGHGFADRRPPGSGEVERAGRSAGRHPRHSHGRRGPGAVLAGFVLLPSFRVPTVLAILAGTLVFAALLASGPGRRGPRCRRGACSSCSRESPCAWPKPRPSGIDSRDLVRMELICGWSATRGVAISSWTKPCKPR